MCGARAANVRTVDLFRRGPQHLLAPILSHQTTAPFFQSSTRSCVTASLPKACSCPRAAARLRKLSENGRFINISVMCYRYYCCIVRRRNVYRKSRDSTSRLGRWFVRIAPPSNEENAAANRDDNGPIKPSYRFQGQGSERGKRHLVLPGNRFNYRCKFDKLVLG